MGSLHCTGCGAANAAEAKFCRQCGKFLDAAVTAAASRGIDWKWIGLGVLVMFGTNFAGGLAVGLAGLSGPGAFAAVGIAAFVAGGFLVGRFSAGKTILEPAVSAVIALAIGLLVQGTFSLVTLLIGGLLPFGCGLLGGWLGEKAQGTI